MYETSDTDFVIESAAPDLFIFTVAAVNVLGKGVESAITCEFLCCMTAVLSLHTCKTQTTT